MAGKKITKPYPIGKKIRRARLKKKIALSDLANDTGYAIDTIKRIESGKELPPVGTLLLLSRALSLDTAELLENSGAKKTRRVEEYFRGAGNYAYTTLGPASQNKHLKAFKVRIDPMSEHKGSDYRHEGEEFVYVLSGKVEIKVGEHVNKLKKGQSLHFNAGIRHNLGNPGKVEAEILSIIYVP